MSGATPSRRSVCWTVALNTGAASQKSAVYRASLSAAWHGKDARRSLGATLSTASTQADVVSAFTVLGIGDFNVRGELPVSEAVALMFEGTTPLADGWSRGRPDDVVALAPDAAWTLGFDAAGKSV